MRRRGQMNRNLKIPVICLLFVVLTSGALGEANLTQLVNKTRLTIATM